MSGLHGRGRSPRTPCPPALLPSPAVPTQGMSQEGGRQAETHVDRDRDTGSRSPAEKSKSAGQNESADGGGSTGPYVPQCSPRGTHRTPQAPRARPRAFPGAGRARVTSARRPSYMSPPPRGQPTLAPLPPHKARCTSPNRPDTPPWTPPAPGTGCPGQLWPAPTGHGGSTVTLCRTRTSPAPLLPPPAQAHPAQHWSPLSPGQQQVLTTSESERAAGGGNRLWWDLGRGSFY